MEDPGTDQAAITGERDWIAFTAREALRIVQANRELKQLGSAIKSVPPTNKRFAIGMVTVGHWKGTTMDHEGLFWDNLDFMKQIGLQ